MSNYCNLRLFGVLLIALLTLSSCVTSSTNARQEHAQQKRAYEDYLQLGLNYLRSGDRYKSRFNFQKALDIKSNSAVAHNGMAWLFELDDDSALAEQHYKKALKSEPKFTQARNNYARFLFIHKRYKQAAKSYAIASRDVNYRLRAAVFVGFGLSEKALGHTAKAEQAFFKALLIDPTSAQALIELTELSIAQKSWQKAQEYLRVYADHHQHSIRSLEMASVLATYSQDAEKKFQIERQLKHLKE